MVEISSAKSKIVAEEQARDKAEAEKRKAAEEQAAAALLSGSIDPSADAGAADILGEAPPSEPAPEADTKPDAETEAAAADVLGEGLSPEVVQTNEKQDSQA